MLPVRVVSPSEAMVFISVVFIDRFIFSIEICPSCVSKSATVGTMRAAVHHQLATLQFHQFLLCCPDQFRVIWNQVMIVQKFQVAHISAGRMRDKTWLK